jgi:hypothetical protein
MQAARVLGRLGGARAIGPLVGLLHDSDGYVSQVALDALKELHAVEALLVAFQDADANVRWPVAVTLGEMQDGRALEPLLAALYDPDWFVRGRAAQALGELGETRAVEPLLAVLREAQGSFRHDVADALKRLGMKDLPEFS